MCCTPTPKVAELGRRLRKLKELVVGLLPEVDDCVDAGLQLAVLEEPGEEVDLLDVRVRLARLRTACIPILA